MPLGYYTDLDEAHDYFNSERLDSSAWDDLSDDKAQETAITMAYNRLYYSKAYTLPAVADATAAQLVYLKKANAEMAYYLIVHLTDEDARKGIQAQGVIEADIVEEVYEKDYLDKVPIPPFVKDILDAGGFLTKTKFRAVNLTRNEDESV